MGLRRATHVAWRRVGDETVLIHLRNKKIYVLNPSGGYFWHSLDGAAGPAEFLGTLTLEDPLPEDASSRLEGFLRDLEDADLVEANGTGSEPAPSPSGAPLYPLASFVPPELVWQQELRNFGQSCAFVSGSGPTCDAVPTM